MITFLDGTLAESLPNRLVIDVNGVGYEVLVPLSSSTHLPDIGGRLRILTHLHVREDAQILYGFQTAEERDLFRLLINRVSGVGPALAMAILSGMSVPDFKTAVVQKDIPRLSSIKGLGKKTAERVVLELKDKLGVAEVWEASQAAGVSLQHTNRNDAILALISLGYKQVEAQKALQKLVDVGELDDDSGVDDYVRAALRKLN